MKKFLLGLMLVIISSCAYADIVEFEYFSLDVPDGWTITRDGPEITLTAPDKSGSLSITADNPDGKTIGRLASEFSQKLRGTIPEIDEDGNYTFEFNNGISQAVITGDEDLYMLVIGTGIESNGDTLIAILESLEMK